jgi:hypothetical protein
LNDLLCLEMDTLARCAGILLLKFGPDFSNRHPI